MLLPITTSSQTLQEIIDASTHTTEIRALLNAGYTNITVIETGTAVYKDTWIAATVANSRPVSSNWITFDIIDISDVTFITWTWTNLIADFNK